MDFSNFKRSAKAILSTLIMLVLEYLDQQNGSSLRKLGPQNTKMYPAQEFVHCTHFGLGPPNVQQNPLKLHGSTNHYLPIPPQTKHQDFLKVLF